MRKIVFGLLLVACVTSVASAQLTLWYDVRPTIAEINTPAIPYTNWHSAAPDPYPSYGIGVNYPLYNSGGRGDGQILYISPKMADVVDYLGNPPGDGIDEHLCDICGPGVDYSVGDFYLYASYAAPAGKVVSSIGVTQDIPAAAFTAGDMKLASVTAAAQNTGLWSGTNFTGSNASISLKMVQVPVAGSPPAFNAGAGIIPGATDQIAKFHVDTAYSSTSALPVGYGVKLAVNALLVTQVQYPGAAGDLAVNFGYVAGAAEAATGTGSVQGATSATDDFTIQVQRKGDYNANGTIDGDDLTAYLFVTSYDMNMVNPAELYLSDFNLNGTPADGDDLIMFLKSSLSW